MATGASTADVAVVLVDARQGVLAQTRRHSIIASLLGIRHVVLAVNKIDLVGFDQARVRARSSPTIARSPRSLGFAVDHADPDVGALRRQRHAGGPTNMPWYAGPTLLEHLETIDVDDDAQDAAVPLPGAVCEPAEPRLPRLCRHGRVGLGRGRATRSSVAKSGKASRVKRIVTQDGDLERAVEGQAVTLVLEDEVEVSRGDMLVAPDARPEVADQFAANVVWFDEHAAAARPLLHPRAPRPTRPAPRSPS